MPSKARVLLERLYHYAHEPDDDTLHKETDALVHADAKRAADKHGETFRAALQNKGLPPEEIDKYTKLAQAQTYTKHYTNAYTGTKRAIRQEMVREA
jgi:hypothetical protein